MKIIYFKQTNNSTGEEKYNIILYDDYYLNYNLKVRSYYIV